jgi:hypothetical protein
MHQAYSDAMEPTEDVESSSFYTSVSAGGHMDEETSGARGICNSGETVLL